MQKIVLGISGASGAIYARLLLEKLSTMGDRVEAVGVVMSDSAKEVWQYELGDFDFKNLESDQNPAIRFYDKSDFMAPFASGSARYTTMIIAPCSMGTLGRIAHGVSDDLMTRAADVMLKERRKLVMVVRETPYNLIHIKNMELVTVAGAIVCPATPSFYSKPTTIEELAGTVINRVLDLAGLQQGGFRWGEPG